MELAQILTLLLSFGVVFKPSSGSFGRGFLCVSSALDCWYTLSSTRQISVLGTYLSIGKGVDVDEETARQPLGHFGSSSSSMKIRPRVDRFSFG
eukprot:908503-Amphidinium_carterae.1